MNRRSVQFRKLFDLCSNQDTCDFDIIDLRSKIQFKIVYKTRIRIWYNECGPLRASLFIPIIKKSYRECYKDINRARGNHNEKNKTV